MIRTAVAADLPQILEIYDAARRFMRANGNPNQWAGGYPYKEILVEDIDIGRLYVCERENALRGVFMFEIGVDPTYIYIEDGEWLDDSEYGVIHRIASDGKTKGVFAECLGFCLEHIKHIRIDTHDDNLPMQHTLSKNGFKRCGIIYLPDGAPRIAYERV